VWPDQPYAPPRGSFLRPVPLPTVDPDASPTCTVSINQQWIPFVIGALQQLLLQATWKTDDPAALLLVQQRAFNLLDLFTCGSGELPFLCVGDFIGSDQPFQTWTVDSGCGSYLGGTGYEATDCGPFGSHTFRQVALIVTLDNPVTLTGLDLAYAMVKGTFDVPGTFDQVYVRDVTHGTTLVALTVDDLVDGTDLHLTWSGHVDGVSSLELVVTSSERNTGNLLDGDCAIFQFSMAGAGLDPCGSE